MKRSKRLWPFWPQCWGIDRNIGNRIWCQSSFGSLEAAVSLQKLNNKAIVTNVAAGAYSLTARAFDTLGVNANSAAINVMVTSIVTGDIFRAARESTRVNFYKNDIPLAQSAGAPAYPIRAAVFANMGRELSNAKLTPDTVAANGFNQSPRSWLQRSKEWLSSLVAVLLQ
jgi:hypothetical protein